MRFGLRSRRPRFLTAATRLKVASPTGASVGNREREGVERGADASGGSDQPEGNQLPLTAPRNIVARPLASAIVEERALWRVKCSVVTNVTAAGRGSVSACSASVSRCAIASPHFWGW